ncbi:MAG: bactofilin family protein [Halanaerobiaceae bacterium]
MFGKKKNKKNKKKTEKAKRNIETIIGTGTVIDGDVKTSETLRVEGKVKGTIKAGGDLFIGESGQIHAEIEARNIIIAGNVIGNIKAEHKIEILPSGKLDGDIQTKSVKIEEGATFTGSSIPFNNKFKNNDVSQKVKTEVAAGKGN